MQSAAQLLTAYLDTRYDVRLPGGRRACLRIGESVPEPVREWVGRDWPLLCISACNPHSQRLSPTANRIRTRQLLRVIQADGHRTLHGVGHVPGQVWREASIFVAAVSTHQADELAREFEQKAIVMADEGKCVRLRLLAEPLWQAMAEKTFADWAGQ
ncbi:MAG: DUF3293 domain-containing protein [Xanthomonadales bacterium]|nr:DUF3293 domain-containing protein [Xanthomonadales bacterium]